MFSSADVSRHLHSLSPLSPSSSTSTRSTDDVDPDRAERTRTLLREAVGADPETVARLHEEVVLLNLEVAESIVMRYRNRGVPSEDLVQVACVGLVKAARGFDPDKSDNFLSYAVPTILGEVKRFFRDSAWVVRPPRRIQELQAEISSAVAHIMHETGRVATPRDIAEEIGVEPKLVIEAMGADGCFAPSSLDRTTGPNEAEGSSLAEVLGDDDRGFERTEALVALRPLCRQLSERDRRIIYLRFFHEWTQARIAEEFGVTQMQISRLLTRILKQLKTQLGDLDGDGVEDTMSVSSRRAILDSRPSPVSMSSHHARVRRTRSLSLG